MRIAFRQGLISFQTDTGAPVYLKASVTSNFVSHVISPTPTLAAIAHGSSDYLLKFDNSVEDAWGPVTPGVTNHLYFDIDILTASVTYGITLLEPVTSFAAPSAPMNDQHWFDMTETMMKVWSTSKNKWISRIRLFAGKVLNGNINAIVSALSGSQVGLNVSSNPGFILLDTMLQPLRKASQNGEFLTDDNDARVLSSVGTSGVLVSPVNRVIPVRAGESIPRMSLVYFSADDTVRLASSNPALVPARVPVGIMIDAVVVGEVGTLVQSGELSYDQWDFSGKAGMPVYCDSSGQITTTRPSGLFAYRVGFIKNPTTVLIMVDAETYPQVYTATAEQIVIAGLGAVQTSDTVNGLGERVVVISVAPASPTQAGLMTPTTLFTLADQGTRLSAAENTLLGKSNTGHTHTINEVPALQSALNGKADTSHDHALLYSEINHNHNLNYAPITHDHTIGEVPGLQTALDQKTFRAHLNSFTEIFPTVNRTGSFDTGTGDNLAITLDGKSNTGHAHIVADVTNLQSLLDGKATASHTHIISSVTGLQTALDTKSDTTHIHTIANVTGLQLALDGLAPSVHAHAISSVTGLQSALDTKSTTGHTHIITDVTGLQLALDGKSDTSHAHAISSVTGLQTALDTKSDTTHIHTIANVTGLQLALDGKSDTSHAHAISSVTGLQTALDTHVHTITNVTGLQIELNGKSNTGHLHAISDVSGLQNALDNAVYDVANVTGLQDVLDGKSDVIHEHTMANVTDLQFALDDKANSIHGHAIADVSGLQTALDTHSHIATDITDLQFALDDKANSIHGHAIADVSGLQTALDTHIHAISNVTGLQTALDGKSIIGHTHTLTEVSTLQTAIDGKASVIHGHAIADVSGLQTALDTHIHAISNVTGLQTAIDGKASVIHGHAIADVSGLQDELDGKASTNHAHTFAALTDVDLVAVVPIIGNTIKYNGVTWSAADSTDTTFTFQVGMGETSHIHHAAMSALDAQYLINATNPVLPVGDALQPSINLITALNGAEPHEHTITVFFDYVNSTLIVGNITDNISDNHTAALVGGGSSLPPGATPGSFLYIDEITGIAVWRSYVGGEEVPMGTSIANDPSDPVFSFTGTDANASSSTFTF